MANLSLALHAFTINWSTIFVFLILFFVISVNAGLVSTWRMMARLVWISTNAPLPFLVANAASTPMAPTSACVWMATKPWSATPTHARLCQVSLIFDLSTCRIAVPNCPTSPLTLHPPHFRWRTFSHYGGSPRDPEAECGWLKLHHLETGKRYLHHHHCICSEVFTGSSMSVP